MAATDAEVAVARDFEWIHNQCSALTPGFQQISMKLREIVLSRPEFARSVGFINNASLLQAMHGSISASSHFIFAPQFRQVAEGHALNPRSRTTLHAYSLYAFLAGSSLKRVLTDLAKAPALPNLFVANSQTCWSQRIRFHKDRIEQFVREHPLCTRTQIASELGQSVEVVRSADPEWFKLHMPKSLSCRFGQHGDRNWGNRDQKLCALVSDFLAKNNSLPFRSYRDALKKLNQPLGLRQKAKGRLPKFSALLESLINVQRTAA